MFKRKNKTTSSIPKPCLENWLEMTPVEKARFCNLCQKNIFDFTNVSDKEIEEAFNRDPNLCGRFLSSQPDQDNC